MFNKTTRCLFLLAFISLTQFALADEKPIRIIATPALENVLPSNIVTIGNVNAKQTVILTAPVSGQSFDKSVTGMVKLIVKTNGTPWVAPVNSAEIDVTIKTYDASSTLISSVVKTLKVSDLQTSSYKDQDYVIFTSQTQRAYKIQSEITQIKINGSNTAVLPNNLLVETSIDYLRYNLLSGTATGPNVVGKDTDGDGSDDILEITWVPVPGALSYELLYSTVNDYDEVAGVSTPKSTSALNVDFTYNSTRITTTGNSYTVPLVFDRGYFACIVRGVGKDITNPSLTTPSLLTLNGPWGNLWTSNIGLMLLNFNSLPRPYYHITTQFEGAKNWQYNASFAEEGKRKDVINFADGSLRPRQTVTQVNSDNTTLVGENVYDYTGRAAINVLPVPLPKITLPSTLPGQYSFAYKNNFNITASGSKYSKNDFDVDDPNSMNPCVPTMAPMSTASGASKYYSSNNPDKDGAQAFVPDAQLYPFSQVEYMPDNTGRIKNQGGVGPSFQIGSGHETKYIYGTPEQLELDRLFGSEAGYSSHYQKNMVIDANGQVSISYIDMEGRTIATCLAGAAPANLVSIPSPAGTVSMKADVFNKNALGESPNNLPNTTGDAIVFNKTFLVTSINSSNSFKYDLSVDKYDEPCMNTGICFNCVYDFEFKITDGCGDVVYTTAASGSKLIGRYTSNGSNPPTFNTICYTPSLYSYQEITTNGATPYILLQPGAYTITKTLRINTQARDFYITQYLDPTKNTCIHDLSYFENLELQHIDYSDCNVSCASCFSNLGTKDNFVALGKGTEEEWQAKYEECRGHCNYPKSSCDIALSQLMMDVSPAGQYGGYANANDPLSVFNPANLLPKNVDVSTNITTNPTIIALATPVAYWKKPIYYTTSSHAYYNTSGIRVKVQITRVTSSTNPGHFNYAIDDTLLHLYHGTGPGQYYTYPEFLANLSDFIIVWQPSFAKSLVTYHPEYCYYQDCATKFNVKSGTDTISSNEYDMKMLYTSTYADAVARQLIIPNTANYGGTGTLLNVAQDPANKVGYYGAAFPSTTPMINRYNTYYNNGSLLPMHEFVSYSLKCATQFGSNMMSNAPCVNFGSNPSVTMQNSEWNMLKSIYFSEKQKMLYAYSNYTRLHSGSCNYYNACIGDASFDGYNTPMVSYSGNVASSSSKYFVKSQPCNQVMKDLYASKVKRFGITIADQDVPDENEMAYQAYIQTGQCPNASDLQSLMNGLASNNKFAVASEQLQNYPQLTINFYNYINGTATAPNPYVMYLWKATQPSGNLNINLTKASNNTVAKFLTLTNITPAIVWANVKNVSQLQFTGTSGTNQTFSCIIKELVGVTLVTKTVNGVTDIKLDGCMFKDVCKPNDLAKEVLSLMSTLKANNTIGSTATLGAPGSGMYGPYLLKAQQLIGQTAATPVLTWQYVSGSTYSYDLYDATTPTCKLRINLLTLNNAPISSVTFPSITSFQNIKSDYQNFFTMDASNANYGLIGTVRGEVFKICSGVTTPVPMGNCEKPDPLSCRTKFHQNRKDLEGLLKDILVNQKYSPPATTAAGNLINNYNLTTNLISTFMPLNSSLPTNRYSVSDYFFRSPGFDTPSATALPNDSVVLTLKSPCIVVPTPTIAPPPGGGGNGTQTGRLINIIDTGSVSGTLNSTRSSGRGISDGDIVTTNAGGGGNPPIIITPTCPVTTYCKLWLKTNNKTAVSPLLITSVTNVKKLVGYGAINNNSYNDFYLLVDYTVGGNVIADTIFGSSCYGIQNCMPCDGYVAPVSARMANNSSVSPNGSAYASKDASILKSAAAGETSAKTDNTLKQYAAYTEKINTLNTRLNLSDKDADYVKPVDYAEMHKKGFFLVMDKYMMFINNYNAAIDDKLYLSDISAYVRDFGFFNDPEKSYRRYVNAVNYYNAKLPADAKKKLVAEDAKTFYKKKHADLVDNYVRGLQNAKTPQSAVAPISYYAKSDARGEEGGDPCQALYQAYVMAYQEFSNNYTGSDRPPFYDYQDFVNNNYCCPQNGLPKFQAYIDLFASPYRVNPGNISHLEPCEDGPMAENCLDLYNYYVDMYNTYSANFTGGNVPPFYNQQDFIDNGYCCVEQGSPRFHMYADLFLAPYQLIPDEIATLQTGKCDEQGCEAMYQAYVNAYQTMEATKPPFSMPKLFTYETFVKGGYCCPDKGSPYFIAYIHLFDTPYTESPGDLIRIPDCNDQGTASGCEESYMRYVSAYNTFANNNGNGPAGMVQLYTLQEFIDHNYCCPANGSPDFASYIHLFDSPYTTMPPPIVQLDPCPVVLTGCEDFYNEYTMAYNMFAAHYPGSPSNLPHFYTLAEFVSHNYCCPDNGSPYFRLYIDQFGPPFQVPPTGLLQLTYCQTPPPPPTGCENAYNDYLNAYATFAANYSGSNMPPQYTLTDFVNNNYCCAWANSPNFYAYINLFGAPYTTAPPALTPAFSCASLPTGCESMFLQYQAAYNNFVSHQSSYPSNMPPAYSLTDFVNNHYCCPSAGSPDLQAYINQFGYPYVNIPGPITQLSACPGVITVPTSCQSFYQDYVNAYNTFVASYTGPLANIPQLYTIEQFMNNNYCCPNTNSPHFQDYINLFSNTTAVPGPLHLYEACNDGSGNPTQSQCVSLYSQFTATLTAYNNSLYAIEHNFFLNNNLFSSSTTFYQEGYCNCIAAYFTYITAYINAGTGSLLSSPVSITHFPGCNTTQTTNYCEQTYNDYSAAVTSYLAYVSTHSSLGLPVPATIYDITHFTNNELCYCADGYVSFLNAIVSGAVPTSSMTYITSHMNIQTFCTAAVVTPCASSPQNQPPSVESPLLPPSPDPCATYKQETAKANAASAYASYLQQLTQAFISNYTDHCMGAVESLERTYQDREFHYTLYYYDQAGNLIRTIPPEGLDATHYTSITQPTDANAIKAKNDRTYKTKTLFTHHRLATTYAYNSLNQLVKQKSPDHDGLTSLAYIFNYGLDTAMRVTTSQFPDPTKGYLGGNEIVPSDPYFSTLLTRGKMFESVDGSLTWKPVNNIAGTDLKKVQFVSTSAGGKYGFAVGTDGAFMVSVDGGTNWDYYPIHQYALGRNFNDLVFSVNPTTQAIKGLLVGDNGALLSVNIANGGPGPVIDNVNLVASAVTFASTDNITDVAFNSNFTTPLYFVTVTNQTTNKSKIYSGTGVTGSPGIWQDITATGVNNLTRVRQLHATNNYYAVGEDGHLLKSATGTDNWNLTETNTALNFLDAYFATANDAVAVLEDPTGIGSLYKTSNGGNNWVLLDQGIVTTKNYRSLSPYINNGNLNQIDKLTANGSNGVIKRISINYTNAASVFTGFISTDLPTTPTPYQVNDVCVAAYNVVSTPASYKQLAVAVGENSQLYYCADYNQNTPLWLPLSATGLPGSLSLKKVLVNIQNPSSASPGFEGVILTSTGYLYNFTTSNFLAATPVFNASAKTNTNSISYSDIVGDWNATNIFEYAYMVGKTSSNAIKFANLHLQSVSSQAPVELSISQTLPPMTNLVVNTTVANTPTVIGINTTGSIYKCLSNNLTVSGPMVIVDESINVIPNRINDITCSAAKVAVIGDDGYYAEKQLSAGGSFMVKHSSTFSDFSSFKYVAPFGGDIYVFTSNQGEAGMLFSNSTNTLTYSSNQLSSSPLNDIDFKLITASTELYAVGDNGAAFYATGPLGNPYTAVPVSSTDNFNTVAFLPTTANNSALITGNSTISYVMSGLTAMSHKSWYTNEITKLHFTDPLNGYFVGKQGLIRHTQDGGATWKTVRPYLNSGNSNLPPDLYGVYTTAPDVAIFCGSHNYLANSNGFGIPASIFAITSAIVGDRWNDLDFANPNEGFVVGTNYSTNTYKAYKLNLTNGVITNIAVVSGASAANMGFKSLFAFRNSSPAKFIGVGESGTLRIYTDGAANFETLTYPGASPLTNFFNSSSTINDVVFSDNTNGYLVGTGTKFVNFTVDHITYNVVPTDMIPPSNAGYNSTSYLNTISIVGGVEGFIGGYRGNGSTVNSKYAWKYVHETGGTTGSRFWYDRLGRLTVSQNSKQAVKTPIAYSYTLYDALGRIIEVGEKAENTTTTNQFNAIFGTLINSYLNTQAIDDAKFAAWIAETTGARTEVTHTYYDIAPITNAAGCAYTSGIVQENLRKRVATVTFENTYDNSVCTYDYGTHYSYDITGNVKTLIQDNRPFASSTSNPLLFQRIKRMDYSYDLISGKVNQVNYQDGQIDAFYHRYDYDADNRITQVNTSRNGIVWETDAKYFYYRHGPLARTELGHDKIQGIDYAYTLQGWLKGTNSNLLSTANDIGKDGGPAVIASVNNPNHLFGADASGFTLGYYSGDYTPIDANVWTSATRFEAFANTTSDLIVDRRNLYNGNISHMATSLVQPSMLGGVYAQQPAPLANAYMYDQLNRVVRSASYGNLPSTGASANSWPIGGGTSSMYLNTFAYDANGNIITQEKRDASSNVFDQLTYHYPLDGTNIKNNKLSYVTDVSTTTNAGELLNQTSTSNYTYDEIGNLKQDLSEQIATIKWTVYGKIKEINRVSGSSKKDLKFDYDAHGERIAKHIYNGTTWESSTYYVRDAQGNIMSTYVNDMNVTCAGCLSYRAIEYPLYGSSRLGLDVHQREMLGTTINQGIYERYVGKKQFELNNHLGNVLAVVSDKKYKYANGGNTQVDHFLTDVLSTSDYYPFGQSMPGRSYTSGNYRYGFNGKENDNEVKGNGNSVDFGARIYDPRLGRWLSLDPLQEKYPALSPYNFCANNPILFIDPDGREIFISYASKVDGKSVIQRVQYKNGELYNSDGKKYTGSNVYLIAVKTQLNDMKTRNPDVNKMVTELETAPNYHEITNSINRVAALTPQANTEWGEANYDISRQNMIVTDPTTKEEIMEGNTVTYFPNPYTDRKDVVDGDKEGILAHELKHGHDKQTGKFKALENSTTKEGVKNSEVSGVKTQNQVLKGKGKAERTEYGGKKVSKADLEKVK